jgi:ubiquinone/menaquinone biosynthesis C-methylase UbiE
MNYGNQWKFKLKSFDYSKISHFYDDLEVDLDLNSGILENLDRIFKTYGCKKVWDGACGTGVQALALADKGYQLLASDIDGDMLGLARAKKCTGNVQFLQGDICELQVDCQDAIISMTNVLSHFDEGRMKALLKNISASLKRGGLYIADFENRSFLEFPDRLPEDFFVSGEGKFKEQNVKRMTKACSLGDGLYEMTDRWKTEEQVIHEASWDLKAWYRDEIQALLEEAGLVIELWSNRSFGKLDLRQVSQVDSLLFIAKKA